MLAFLPVVIDMTNLHIAVPSLPLALGASVTEVLWIIDIYPLLIAGMLALLGLPLSIGLTASSIAIMGSVEASKGGGGGLAGSHCVRVGCRPRDQLLRRIHVQYI